MASMEFKNNSKSTVADNPLAAGATTLNVASGEGANFPSSCPFLLTLWNRTPHPTPGDDSGMEIVRCTGRTTDALTIVRAQESTADVEHTFGERVAMLITAGHFDDSSYGIVTKLDTIETNAKDNQTGSEIVALINAGADLIDDDNVASTIARDSEVSAHFDTSTGHDHDGTDSKKVVGGNVINTPAGNIVATDVQAAITELDEQDTTNANDISAVGSGLTTHMSDQSTHGVTEIVGRTESQTLSNKSFLDGVDIAGQLQGALINNQMVSKAAFDILSLMTDPRCLYMQCDDPGAGTLYDQSGQGHDGTYEGSMTTGDRIKKGMGWALDFDGANDHIDLGDHDDFSFGDGDNDSAVTWFGMFEVVDTATTQAIIAKWNGTALSEAREWYINLGTAEALALVQFDESVDKFCTRTTNSALSLGWHTWAITSPGDGGATAMNNVKIYIDGVEVASTAVNDVDYVAMENLATPVWIGARESGGGNPEYFLSGDNALTGIDGSEWSAFDVHRAHELFKGLYGL